MIIILNDKTSHLKLFLHINFIKGVIKKLIRPGNWTGSQPNNEKLSYWDSALRELEKDGRVLALKGTFRFIFIQLSDLFWTGG